MTRPQDQDTLANHFIAFAGDAAELVSFNRSVGQLYGALYIAGKAMSLKELAGICKMSKGNASIHLRILEEWGAVQSTSRPGTREDYYIANFDLSELMVQRVRQGMTKRLALAKTKLQSVKQQLFLTAGGDPKENSERSKKIENLEKLLNRAESFISLFSRFSKLHEMFSFGESKLSKPRS